MMAVTVDGTRDILGIWSDGYLEMDASGSVMR